MYTRRRLTRRGAQGMWRGHIQRRIAVGQVSPGLGRIVASYHRSSTLYQIC
jgi:hypothetical protein